MHDNEDYVKAVMMIWKAKTKGLGPVREVLVEAKDQETAQRVAETYATLRGERVIGEASSAVVADESILAKPDTPQGQPGTRPIPTTPGTPRKEDPR